MHNQKIHDDEMDLSFFATDEFVVEDLPESGALGSFSSVACIGTAPSTASTAGTGSTFS